MFVSQENMISDMVTMEEYIPESLIEFLLTLGDSEQGASARYEVADMLGIPVEKVNFAILSRLGERQLWKKI